ncbi:hypothetical protein ACVIRO_004464 [Rhizobium ruizarguesonis]
MMLLSSQNSLSANSGVAIWCVRASDNPSPL